MATISTQLTPEMEKYRVENNTFIEVAKNDPKDKVEVFIGDDKEPSTFYPQVKHQRWDNECNVSYRLLNNEKGAEKITTEGSKIKWSRGNVEAHFYDLEEGYEMEVVLLKKPRTNVVQFSLVDKDVEYFYQPALTEKEIEDGAHRPENVVGSYAVYAKTPKTNYVGGKEYKCGKVGHIYRPKIHDSAGAEVWGELDIKNQILSVTIPQDFLDKAVYPVVVDPTFGYTTAGGTSSGFGNKPTATDEWPSGGAGLLDSISVYGYRQDGYSTDIQMALYDGSNLEAETDIIVEPSTTLNWKTANAETGKKNVYNKNYRLVLWNKTSGRFLWYYDSSRSCTGYSDSTTPAWSSSFPSTISWSSGSYPLTYSIYATYTKAEIEQEGFAFGDDDGNEASHTLAAQDTNITAALGTKTLRAVFAPISGPSSNNFKLKYQKNGSGGYLDVPVGATSPIPAGPIESGDVTNSGNNTASASWAISHPAAATGDLIIFNVAWDDSTNTTTLAPPAGPNGETAVVIEDVVASASTAVRGKVVYYKATGDWSAGTLTFTPGDSEQWTASVIKVLAGEFDATTPIGAHGNNPSTGTSDLPATPAITAGASDGGGKVVAWFASDTDDLDGTVTGWTELASIDRGAAGGDLIVRDTPALNSEAIAEVTGWTHPSGRNWVSFIYIVRGPGGTTPNQIYVSASSNVASGGEATTARLTAPSGKTTSNFTTGRRWDDENGTDSIDIAEDYYTELEWVLTTQSPATTDDYFDFRVYDGDNALTTYTVTPRWTITAGGGSVAPTVTTQAVSSIAQTTATGNGNVTADGGATVTERGVCWGTSTNPTIAGSHDAADAGGEGAFTADITSLSAKTHYYVRAYATNSVGTSYGDNVEFDTSGDFVIADESSASSIDDIALIGNFQIADESSESTIDQITIERNGGDFTIADANSTSSIDNVSIEQVGTFLVGDIEVTSQTENITLEQAGGTLEVGEISLASEIDNIGLEGNFIIDGMTCETTTEEVVLEFAGAEFVIADISSTSENENIDLIGEFIIDSINAPPTIENITLEIGGGDFVIDGMTSSSTIGNLTIIEDIPENLKLIIIVNRGKVAKWISGNKYIEL
jgi:hypothetical protein